MSLVRVPPIMNNQLIISTPFHQNLERTLLEIITIFLVFCSFVVCGVRVFTNSSIIDEQITENRE